jgi:hypothetical protein
MNTTKAELKLEARGVKSFLGREGHGFNASLYINGKKAAFVMDSADGGMYDWRWLDKDAEKAFAEHIEMIPPVGGEFPHNVDADEVMGGLVDDALNARRFARLMKTKTVFRLKSDKDGDWRTLNGGPYSPAAREWLVKKYGDNLGEIMNERKS